MKFRYRRSVVVFGAVIVASLAATAAVAQDDVMRGGNSPTTIVSKKVAPTPIKTTRTELRLEKPIYADTPLFRGEGHFVQRCSTCHMTLWQKDGPKAQHYGPPLTGVLAGADKAREETVRKKIREGSVLMPGFNNAFTAAEFNDLIAYMKTL